MNQKPLQIPAGTPLLFDMDGTITDNMGVHHRAWQSVLRELGKDLTLAEVQDQAWGKNSDIFERIFPGRFSAAEIYELAEEKERRYIEIYSSSITMMAGLEVLLAAAVAAKCPMAIVTAAPAVCVDFVFSKLQLERFFPLVVNGDDVERSKPYPDPYLKAAERLGVPPSSCLVFEDAPVGIKSAQDAGMRAYVVLTTHRREEFAKFSNILGFLNDFSSLQLD